MIKITFLGTSDAVPSSQRNHTAILLNYNEENILVDCGEGTQRQFRKAELNPCKLTRILITHWHGDHVLGIPGLLQTLALSGYNKKLFIYGPKGTKEFMRNLLKTFFFVNKLNFEVIEILKDGKFFDSTNFYLEAKLMAHGVPCFAYSFVKKGQIRIDKEKLKKYKLSEGPFLQKLKEGKDIIYNGKKYISKNLTFKEEDKKVSIVLDTKLNDKIAPFVKNSDILICESSFHSELEERAKEYTHLTSKQAGEIAKKSNSKKLILTHISQRYLNDSKKILDDARSVFKNAFLVNDLDNFEI